jgi:predicted HTH transcriptional regulator
MSQIDELLKFGLCTALRSGYPNAMETLARNGNPPIEFKFDLGPVMAIIRKKERSSRAKQFKDLK